MLVIPVMVTGSVLWTGIAFVSALGSAIAFDLFVRLVVNRGTLVTGDDGVQLTALRLSRFIAYDSITAIGVDVDRERITLDMRGGDEIEVQLEHPELVATELYERLDQSVEGGATAPTLSLKRGGAGFIPWRSRLRRVLGGRYREQTMTPELLIRVAEDPNADVEQRIGAAVALAEAPESYRVRVRVAAESVARADVGAAMTQAVEGTLDGNLAERLTKPP